MGTVWRRFQLEMNSSRYPNSPSGLSTTPVLQETPEFIAIPTVPRAACLRIDTWRCRAGSWHDLRSPAACPCSRTARRRRACSAAMSEQLEVIVIFKKWLGNHVSARWLIIQNNVQNNVNGLNVRPDIYCMNSSESRESIAHFSTMCDLLLLILISKYSYGFGNRRVMVSEKLSVTMTRLLTIS